MAYIVYDKDGKKTHFNHKIDVKEAIISKNYFLEDPTGKETNNAPPIVTIEEKGPDITDATVEQDKGKTSEEIQAKKDAEEKAAKEKADAAAEEIKKAEENDILQEGDDLDDSEDEDEEYDEEDEDEDDDDEDDEVEKKVVKKKAVRRKRK